jgi:glycosyltransferase involved in cell wall biosynthesis
VDFLGQRDDVRDLVPGFDAAVNCSSYEGVSLTIIEAMAAARPIVATRVGGTPEVLRDAETGLLVPPADRDALASALLALAEDPERAAALGRAARGEAERRFAFDDMLAAYEAASRGER